MGMGMKFITVSFSSVYFAFRTGGQFYHRREQSSESRAVDYNPAPSFTCPPNAADLPQTDDSSALNIVIRKQLDSVITKHVQHGLSVSQTSLASPSQIKQYLNAGQAVNQGRIDAWIN